MQPGMEDDPPTGSDDVPLVAAMAFPTCRSTDELLQGDDGLADHKLRNIDFWRGIPWNALHEPIRTFD